MTEQISVRLPNGKTEMVKVSSLASLFENLESSGRAFGLQLSLEIHAEPAKQQDGAPARRIYTRTPAAPARRSSPGRPVGSVQDRLKHLLATTGMNVSEAARKLGVSKSVAYYYAGKIQKADKEAKRVAKRA